MVKPDEKPKTNQLHSLYSKSKKKKTEWNRILRSIIIFCVCVWIKSNKKTDDISFQFLSFIHYTHYCLNWIECMQKKNNCQLFFLSLKQNTFICCCCCCKPEKKYQESIEKNKNWWYTFTHRIRGLPHICLSYVKYMNDLSVKGQ